jgi:uncharacterized membrane protein YqaE (UPF0057 family)
MLVLSLLLPPLHLALTRGLWTRRNVLRVFLIYAFVFDVGAVGFFFASFRTSFSPTRRPS